MEMSVREFKAKVSAAIAAAERGETVTITKFGKAVVDLVASKPKKSSISFDKLDAFLKHRGLDNVEVFLPDYFDDPAFSRKVLGLED
jgi:antitoxin (DNA-binding transcriptional repressor) of toxin-antitoxin stability system